MKLPKWGDDDEVVAAWANKELDDAYLEDERRDALYPRDWDTGPGISMADIVADAERKAVTAAADGDFRPLAYMMENPLFQDQPFGLEVRATLVRILLDPAKPRRGPRRHLPKYTKVSEANQHVMRLTAILRRRWPNETGHTEQAITIAAKREGIGRKTLVSYRKEITRKPRKRVG